MIMYRLLGFPTPNVLKTLYVLEEVGADYKFEYVDLTKGEHKRPEFLKLNPVGKIPVLVRDGESLFESGAICRYVANAADSPLYPKDKMQRARVDQWMDFFSLHLGRWLSTLFFENLIKKRFGAGDPDPKTCEEALKFAREQLSIVDRWLQGSKYFVGNNLTIADLFAFAYLELTGPCRISMGEFPHVQSWLEKVGSRESIQKARGRAQR